MCVAMCVLLVCHYVCQSVCLVVQVFCQIFDPILIVFLKDSCKVTPQCCPRVKSEANAASEHCQRSPRS